MIHILGSGGMLGNYVFRFLSMKYGCVGHTRHSFDVVRDLLHLGKLDLHTGSYINKTKCWPVGGREYAHSIDLGVGIHFKVVIPEKCGS